MSLPHGFCAETFNGLFERSKWKYSLRRPYGKPGRG